MPTKKLLEEQLKEMERKVNFYHKLIKEMERVLKENGFDTEYIIEKISEEDEESESEYEEDEPC